MAKQVTHSCLTCSKEFSVYLSWDIQRGGAKYCSNTCKGVASRIEKIKPTREQTSAKMSASAKARIARDPEHLKLITRLARAKTTGAGNVNWKGGISTERHKAMRSLKYQSWRTLVFRRDNFTCQICDQYSGALHADHIKQWKDYPDLRFEVTNGRTLCVPCHYYVTFKRKMKPGTKWCGLTARKVG